jgi:ribonuclease HI
VKATKVIVHVDGGARGNPGPAAAACVVSAPDGNVLGESSELLGVTTNNVAEYRALLLGLARARALGAFARWSIRSVPRAQNADADALVNAALNAAA